MIPHNCTRQVEVISFIEKENSAAKSGWFLDYFFTTRRTQAEVLEVRNYAKGNVKPLLYVGSCLPPNLVKNPKETLTVKEFTWPTIKGEIKITGCDVDERRILPNGDLVPVGRQRFDNALNWGMMGLIDGVRATHICEAINLMKTGGYVLHSSDTENMGTVDFCREDQLKDIDLSGTDAAWDNMCAKPLKTIEQLAREMSKCKGISGVIDIIHSEYSWEWLEAHAEREAIKYNRDPRIAGGFDVTPYTGYDDVIFKGTTNGGQFRHWVSYAVYIDHTGAEVPVLAPGEIMIASRSAFNGQRVFRTVTSDNREFLPDGANFFLYDDLDKEYDSKCRSFSPWLEESHLMVPGNVNGSILVRVVAEDAGDPCTSCEVCPPATPVVP